MRILHVLNDLSSMGNGIVNLAVDLACAQVDRGHEVAVASADGGYLDLLQANGVAHFPLVQRFRAGSISADLLPNIKRVFSAIFTFRRIVQLFQPDIVHCHMITGTIIARVCRLNHPYRLVSHIHNVHQTSANFARFADKSIAVSDGVAKEMSARGFREGSLVVIRNGVLGTKRLSEDYADVDLAQPAIVTVAGLHPRKNIDGVIDAFEQLAPGFPNAHLYIVGDGERARYETYAAQKSAAARIHFAGFQQDPRPYMRASEIFVLASHRDAFGLVLQEAREAGAAIIATNVDGIPEALDFGEAGLLVRPGDVDELAAAMRLLLSDNAKRKGLKCKARQNLQHCTTLHMSREVEALYDELLSSRATVSADGLRHRTLSRVEKDL